MTVNFKGNFSATAIGSLPHENVEDATDLTLETLCEIPCWSQVPRRDLREDMCIQYTEGLPCAYIDKEKKELSIDDAKDTTVELEKFYEAYLENDPSLFAISREYSAGFYTMLERLEKSRPSSLRALKGQVVGPITLAGSLKLSSGILALYSEEFFDVIIKLLSMKAYWQLTKLSRYNLPVMVFADEPYLTSFGSSHMNISKERIVSALNEVYDMVQAHGGLTGTHCCGNTDWAMLMETNLNIVSFDAYEFMDKYLMYWREIIAFLDKGGYLAWGIVPTSSKIAHVSSEELINKMKEGVAFLIDKGLSKELIKKRSLITPSCGAGTLSVEEAEKVMRLTKEVSLAMQKNK